jgi:hypothetical protein
MFSPFSSKSRHHVYLAHLKFLDKAHHPRKEFTHANPANSPVVSSTAIPNPTTPPPLLDTPELTFFPIVIQYP